MTTLEQLRLELSECEQKVRDKIEQIKIQESEEQKYALPNCVQALYKHVVENEFKFAIDGTSAQVAIFRVVDNKMACLESQDKRFKYYYHCMLKIPLTHDMFRNTVSMFNIAGDGNEFLRYMLFYFTEKVEV